MPLLFKILVIIGIILILRLLVCLSKLIQIKRYYRAYLDYIKNPSSAFCEKKPQIIKLFEDAQISNFMIPRLQAAGWGHIAKMQINGFENITLLDHEIIPIVEIKFHEAIGVYRHKLLQTINPVFWIEFIFKLPVYTLDYFGLKSDNVFVKIIQIMYWIIGILIGLEKLGILKIFKSM